jgi:hypothetical protein
MTTVAWRRLDRPGFELAFVDLSADRLRVAGSVLAAGENPHRLAYEVETAAGFATTRLEVETRGDGWRRWLRLERHHDGWSCDAGGSGPTDLAPPGGDLAPLDDALDVDLGFSPLFNTLPIRRLGLLGPGADPQTLVAAFVTVPELGVQPSWQRYEPLDDGRVRYVSVDSGFTADLEVDSDGLVVTYPGLAARA